MAVLALSLSFGACEESPTGAIRGSVQAGRELAAEINLKGIADCVRLFEGDVGRLPSTEEGVDALWDSSRLKSDADRWNGPYVPGEAAVRDRFGNKVVYERTTDGFVLRALGEDNAPGGEGKSADVEHREAL